MRVIASAALATALLGAGSVAYAADFTGTIKSLNATKSLVTLDNDSTYVAPKSVNLSNFKVGEKVTMSYTKAGDKKDITSIKALSGHWMVGAG
jgi:uncharacterized protein (AIM24 family)